MGRDADEEEGRLTRQAAAMSSAAPAAVPSLLARRPLAFAAPTPAVTASSRDVRRPPSSAARTGRRPPPRAGLRPPAAVLRPVRAPASPSAGGREKEERSAVGREEIGRLGEERSTRDLSAAGRTPGEEIRERGGDELGWAVNGLRGGKELGWTVKWAERGGGEEGEYFD